MEPEQALWTEVFNQTIKDMRTLIRKAKANPNVWSNPLFQREVRSLQRWFHTKSYHPGGFGFVCEVVGINPESAFIRINEEYLRHLVPVIPLASSIQKSDGQLS